MGLENAAEFIIGTNPNIADSDGDGIKDRIELQQDLDPLGGKTLPSGVIASQTMLGDAVALDVVTDPVNPAKLTAFVATGSRGLAVVDVSRYSAPILLADIDLPGNAQDVAVDALRQRALVAARRRRAAGARHFESTSPGAADPRCRSTDRSAMSRFATDSRTSVTVGRSPWWMSTRATCASY